MQDAATAPNMVEMEMQWAVKAFDEAEEYFALLEKTLPDSIKRVQFTPALDSELYAHFRNEFPDFPLHGFEEELHFKAAEMKVKWREFMNTYEDTVEDFNFGAILRINPMKDISENNTIFCHKLQFIVVELARCREGIQYGIVQAEE